MSDLPRLVSLESELIAEHRRCQDHLAAALSSVDPAVGSAWLHTARRLLLEGLANVQPVFGDVERPLLVPPPRRYLDRAALQRLEGARAALRHVDSALTMATMPGGRHVLQASTPCVLNALLAGPVTERETNAGLIRVTPTNWLPDANPFEHPPADRVADMMDAAIATARDGSGSAVERAGWLAFVTMTVHPFVDGNGRTARALFLATAGTDLPGDIDWGVLDQWHLARNEYVHALQAGQRVDRYDPTAVDPMPFVRFAIIASTRGAAVGAARLELLSAAVREIEELRDPLILRVIADRFVSIDSVLADTPEDGATALDHVDHLVDRRFLALTHAGAEVPRDEVGSRGLVIGDGLADVATRLRRVRFG